MNYFMWFHRDHAAATKDLTWQEDLALRRLFDLAYDTELPLTRNLRRLFLQVGARTKGQQKAVCFVLDRYFIETPEGWVNQRVLSQLEKARAVSEAAREKGKKGGRPRKQEKPEVSTPDGTSDGAGKAAAFRNPAFHEKPEVLNGKKLEESCSKAAVNPTTNYEQTNWFTHRSVVARASKTAANPSSSPNPNDSGDDAPCWLAEKGAPDASPQDAAPVSDASGAGHE
ncbi:hypothetical protein CBM2615_A120160 [Cupriavidus taiwanensis]|uniref:DUF1376 domain-containing protein n=1 Tax=Cupriavidus taiwanensis TaxID=164546 RepID=A0A375DWY1_9BURK|nr:DUF1376 domain-containing protein [Cupriavidus taiwanensis]SOZ49338.1 hypothetical protein CBM2615_A120160 [Cupriavidus taiwanensis]SOZ49404.1 hypothetical protein CBM2614_A120157 [Cupriavidus taiwanensis]SOZ52004.1 hypothetical protein CBM2613_A110159 [Cupriavidus taiwanensis]SPA07168.1 hypothetical protein CBM2625_A90157 [Cupriavidus taiwanensis]